MFGLFFPYINCETRKFRLSDCKKNKSISQQTARFSVVSIDSIWWFSAPLWFSVVSIDSIVIQLNNGIIPYSILNHLLIKKITVHNIYNE